MANVKKPDAAADLRRYNKLFEATLQKYMVLNDLDIKGLAKRIGISEGTLRRRLVFPVNFKIREATEIFSVLKVPPEEIPSLSWRVK